MLVRVKSGKLKKRVLTIFPTAKSDRIWFIERGPSLIKEQSNVITYS